MSSKWVWAFMLAVLVSTVQIVGFAAAQEQGGRRGGGMMGRGGIFSLLAAEPVQKELSIEGETKEKVSALLQEFRTEAGEKMQAIGFSRDASQEEREKMFAKFQEVTKELNAKYLPKLKEVLNEEQFNRLRQISWQAAGAGALSDPELVKALELSKKQQDDLAAIAQEFQQKMRELRGAENALAKFRELGQERDKKAEEVLTKEQQEEFNELKGKPFDLSQLLPSGGQRRGKDNG